VKEIQQNTNSKKNKIKKLYFDYLLFPYFERCDREAMHSSQSEGTSLDNFL
jgi:hypothetical protein